MEKEGLIFVGARVIAVALLVLLNAFFVAAEFALVKVRDTQLRPLAQRGHRRARVAELILNRLDAFLSAAQLGITLASLGLGWIGEPVFTALLSPVFGWLQIQSEEARRFLAFAVGFSALTFLHISAGEQAPKWMAIQKPLPTALWVAYPMLWFYRASYPFVAALNWFSQWLLRQAGIQPASETRARPLGGGACGCCWLPRRRAPARPPRSPAKSCSTRWSCAAASFAKSCARGRKLCLSTRKTPLPSAWMWPKKPATHVFRFARQVSWTKRWA